MDIIKMRHDYIRLVLCVFDKCAGRKWTGNWKEPGWIWDEHAQERKQRISVLMTESGETTT